MTNYESIKNMSKEEMAIWLCQMTECSKCSYYRGCNRIGDGARLWLEDEYRRADNGKI